MSTKSFSVNTMAKVAILGALAYLVMIILEIPLWFAPSFYKIDLSEVIVLIGAFALGPIAGIAIEGIKILLNIITTGTQTMFVGEFANFVIGLAYILPAAIYYRRHKDKNHAVMGMILGTIGLMLVGCEMNYYVLIPAYSVAFHMEMSDLVAMGTAVNPNVSSLWELVLLCTLPFNLIKGIITSIIVTLLYKKVSPILHQ